MAKNESIRELTVLPAVYELLEHPRLAAARAALDHALLVPEIQAHLAAHREALRSGARRAPPTVEAVANEVAAACAQWLTPRVTPVINLTGTLLHTNLGRAPLSAEARLDGARALRSRRADPARRRAPHREAERADARGEERMTVRWRPRASNP